MNSVPAPAGPDGLILFDGVCVFCSRWVKWVIRRDKVARFRFLAMQSPRGREMTAELGLDPDAPQSHAVIVNGRALFKSDAGLAVLASLPGWRWSGALALLPKAARDWFYDRIARNRYRLFGRTETCWVPPAEVRERFLG